MKMVFYVSDIILKKEKIYILYGKSLKENVFSEKLYKIRIIFYSVDQKFMSMLYNII